jgi:hypothetical protein
MTVRQIIAEIEALPREEQEQVRTHLQQQVDAKENSGPVRYADHATAMKAADRIFEERAGLFRKLAN